MQVEGGETAAYVGWEELYVSREPGKREVNYYLKRKDGCSDLVVVGKEKSLRHMSYHYAIKDKSLLSISLSSSLLKLRSRREVIDWLNSIAPDSGLLPHCAPQQVIGSLDDRNSCKTDIDMLEFAKSRKLGKHTTEYFWLGSPWTCRKKRRHYKSFWRNGIEISVHDFVYVLAEEDKRLVAYLDDMYEDSRGNKTVVVRWFHKVDEVGIVLPHNYNDREIFFSLCIQDLSIECIDGLASVLSLQHYEKFLKEARHTQLEPFVCHRQFENDEIKPYDVTQIKGYWKQEILRYMFATPASKVHLKSQSPNDGPIVEGNCDDPEIRHKKRLRRSRDDNLLSQSANKQKASNVWLDVRDVGGSSIGSKGGNGTCSLKEVPSAASSSGKDAIMQEQPQHLSVGSQVEVLSQDSGIRGCWFRAIIIRKSKDKVKVRYLDIKDACDEASNLEEWLLASKAAVPDKLSHRLSGRTTVRPSPLSSGGSSILVESVGSVVDAWWHDGWWEGIVIGRESDDRIHVHFPGEKLESVFRCCDLRPSQEWLGSRWKYMEGRPELVTFILSDSGRKLGSIKSCDGKADQATCSADKKLVGAVHKKVACGNPTAGFGTEKMKDAGMVQDLSKDGSLAQLKWKSSRKRKLSRNSYQNLHHSVIKHKSSSDILGTRTSDRFFIPSSLSVENENCKYGRDSLFGSSVASPLTSLVMSR
ncbi:hypothetical protein RJ640_017937 [Escallonia rubra]|uniref:BAH domain-containing protein n=1 Tax=Escallonia rubra TaxID=112253 RepID=A0AA88QKH1_9ASTE|nr:hypothetical protein RJ640_017937 [Escallonia rubra]